MTERDIKLLWGRAAARCAFPDCRLSLVMAAAESGVALTLGEQAHIVGEKPSAPRGASPLSASERDGYANRVLLCPTHHTLIDRDEAAWPVERLHALKTAHELWVEERFTTAHTVRAEAADLIYAHLMDRATDLCHLDSWSAWASAALEPLWRLDRALIDDIDAFRLEIFVADWPGRYPELEVALDRLSFELQEATSSFVEHADLDGDAFHVSRRYKERWRPQPEYDRLHREFFLWSDAFELRLMEATKAANWMREVWRGEVNPMFLATEGHFHLTLWPDLTLRYRHIIPTYTDEDKAELLTHGIRAGDVRPPAPEPRD